MRSGAAIPRAIAKTAVAKLRIRIAGSREGEEMESTRKRSPSTTATALKAYTTGLLTMSIAAAAGIYALGALMPAVLLVMPGAVAARQSKRLLDQIPLSTSFGVLSAAVAHFLYTALPWLWPSAALGLVLALLLAVGFRGRG